MDPRNRYFFIFAAIFGVAFFSTITASMAPDFLFDADKLIVDDNGANGRENVLEEKRGFGDKRSGPALVTLRPDYDGEGPDGSRLVAWNQQRTTKKGFVDKRGFGDKRSGASNPSNPWRFFRPYRYGPMSSLYARE